jgi:hypothetical protein
MATTQARSLRRRQPDSMLPAMAPRGALTLPQAAATLAIAITGYEAGILDADVVDAVILLIFVTCLVGPVLTARAGEGLRSGPPPGASGGQSPSQRIS